METRKIISTAEACGISLNEGQAELFVRYYHLLQTENKKYNLTRICGEEAVLYDHFIDSLWGVAAAGGCPAKELLDLGSGAGFPGVPLKIFCPQIKLHILEASHKKHAFLEMLTDNLGLTEVIFLKGRAEELGRGKERESYGWVTARAVASLPVLAELALPLLRLGGLFWAFKGPSSGAELKESEQIVNRCGGVLRQEMSYALPPQGKKRCILVFEKVKAAEQRFPRRVGVPQKRPFLG